MSGNHEPGWHHTHTIYTASADTHGDSPQVARLRKKVEHLEYQLHATRYAALFFVTVTGVISLLMWIIRGMP